jgi:hypothetical protein
MAEYPTGQRHAPLNVPIILRFNSPGSRGYVLVAWVISRSSVPRISTAARICAMVGIPVDSTTGRPAAHMAQEAVVGERRRRDLQSDDREILEKSAEGSSQTEANHCTPFSRQYQSISRYSSRQTLPGGGSPDR